MSDRYQDNLQDVIFWGVCVVVVGLLCMTETAQLMFVSIKSLWNGFFAFFIPPLARKLFYLAKYSWPFTTPHYDLKTAEYYYSILSRSVYPVRTGVTIVVSLLVGKYLWNVLKSSKTTSEHEVVKILRGRGQALEKAKKIVIYYAPAYKKKIEACKDFEEFLQAYEEIRKLKNIPNNIVARCFKEGSGERLRILDVGRSRKLLRMM